MNNDHFGILNILGKMSFPLRPASAQIYKYTAWQDLREPNRKKISRYHS